MCVELTLLSDPLVVGGAEKNKICHEAYMYMLKAALRPVTARQ